MGLAAQIVAPQDGLQHGVCASPATHRSRQAALKARQAEPSILGGKIFVQKKTIRLTEEGGSLYVAPPTDSHNVSKRRIQ